jgi:hypothetical protein
MKKIRPNKYNFPLTSGGSNGDVVKEEIVNVPSVFPCVLMVRAKSLLLGFMVIPSDSPNEHSL